MSGGSWDYVCYKVADAANALKNQACPYRQALGQHLVLVAEALHDIEWVDSCDKSPGDEIESIKKVVSPKSVLCSYLEECKATLKKLKVLIDDCDRIEKGGMDLNDH